jgi:pimeloyl-ACP methyl ester carboxylesterase
MHALLAVALLPLAAARVAPIETVRVPLPGQAERIAVHCVEPPRPSGQGVLFAHGATFPTRLAFGFEFAPGDSWMHAMAARGYVVCGVDFLGFGASDRPASMQADATAAPPAVRAPEAAGQIAAAADYLQRERKVSAIHLVAHSWGTIPAAAFAARRPPALKSLTLFGPIVPTGEAVAEPGNGAWFAMTAQQRLEELRFASVLPPGKVLLEPAVEARWADAFRASAPRISGDAPERIRIPNGPNADIADAEAGRYPYSAEDIDVPVFAVYGNDDVVVRDAGAAAFLRRFTHAPLKWRLRIDDGTHVMHLERGRRSLYESVAAFISAASNASP